MKPLLRILVASLVLLPALSAFAQQTCDRDCLIDLSEQYFEAMLAHDTSLLDISPSAKFVENLMPLQPGEGLWQTITAVPSNFNVIVPDPIASEVGVIAILMELDEPILIGLRLKVEGTQLIEMEHVIASNLSETNLLNLRSPPQVCLQIFLLVSAQVVTNF